MPKPDVKRTARWDGSLDDSGPLLSEDKRRVRVVRCCVVGCGIRARMADTDRLRQVEGQYAKRVLVIIPLPRETVRKASVGLVVSSFRSSLTMKTPI